MTSSVVISNAFVFLGRCGGTSEFLILLDIRFPGLFFTLIPIETHS